MLRDLFVDPARHGVGGRLLNALCAFDREPARIRRCVRSWTPAEDHHMSSGENLVGPGCVPSPSLG